MIRRVDLADMAKVQADRVSRRRCRVSRVSRVSRASRQLCPANRASRLEMELRKGVSPRNLVGNLALKTELEVPPEGEESYTGVISMSKP